MLLPQILHGRTINVAFCPARVVDDARPVLEALRFDPGHICISIFPLCRDLFKFRVVFVWFPFPSGDLLVVQGFVVVVLLLVFVLGFFLRRTEDVKLARFSRETRRLSCGRGDHGV